MVTLQAVVLGVKSSTLKTANEENCISQVETNLLYLRDEFGDMMYLLTDSEWFNVLHLEDGMHGKYEFPASSFPEKCSMGRERGGTGAKKNYCANGPFSLPPG